MPAAETKNLLEQTISSLKPQEHILKSQTILGESS
jgi:hypothetical protein